MAAILLLMVVGGCTVNEEKNIFQLAGVNREEIAKVKIARAGKTIELRGARAASPVLQPMESAVPAPDAGNTRIGPAGEGDYIIEVFTGTSPEPVRYYYNSEKQWLYFTKGKKSVHPYKCEALLEPLSQLFKINSFRVIIKEKEGLPRHFNAVDWFDSYTLYGLRGNQFTIWDPDKGTVELLLQEAWEILLSPDRARLAYTNKRGLNIFDLKTLKSKPAVENSGKLSVSQAAPVCWSPDSDKLLYAIEHEWYSDFYILDIATGKSSPYTFNNVDNFLSKPAAWLKNGNILFLVSSARSRDGDRAYMSAGYRSDLMEGSPEGNFRAITRMEDYSYISLAGLTGDEREALVLIREKGLEYKAALVDLAGGDLAYLPWSGSSITAGISPDGRFVAAAAPLREDLGGYRLELLDRHTGAVIFTYDNPDYTVPDRLSWHPGSRKFFYLEKCLEDAANNKLRMVKILPG